MISKRSSLIGAVLGLAALACTNVLNAQEGSYEMTAYADRPGGPELLAGRHAAAIEAAGQARPRGASTALVAHTTLCVAYTLTRRFADARVECGAAVELAEHVDRRPGSRIPRSTAKAKALTNRGVLRAVSGDALGAARDFRHAARLDGVAAPARNLAKLERTSGYRLALANNN